jgi:hypothetical protein
MGASLSATGLSPTVEPASSLAGSAASIPSADTWFCDRGDFWGTIRQLTVCARCGSSEKKRFDEPRNFAAIGTAGFHMICDPCFDALPDGEDL